MCSCEGIRPDREQLDCNPEIFVVSSSYPGEISSPNVLNCMLNCLIGMIGMIRVWVLEMYDRIRN